ncbi:integrase core domain-containing protein, partial [Telmatospirillum sp.]
PYAQSDERAEALPKFLDYYNHHRPHFGLKGMTPISRIPLNNLLRHDS